jgi:hypothetical protein
MVCDISAATLDPDIERVSTIATRAPCARVTDRLSTPLTDRRIEV